LIYQSQWSQDVLYAANGVGLFGNIGTRISGTSDLVEVMPFTFDSVPNVRIDLGTKDLSDRPNDRITFNGAIGARGLQNLTVATGIGDDDLMVYNADLRLALAGGEFWFEDGTGFDRLMVRGDTNWRLNDARLLSDAGGRIRIAGVEQVYMTGGAGNNELTAVGFSGSVTLDGDAGNDILRGTNQHDAIFGRGGMDQIFGGKGNDLIDGGSEADTIYFDGTTENDDERLQYVSSSSANFRRKLRDTTAVLELDLLTYDSADRFEVRALGGNDLLTIDLAFGILGTVNGGDGTDTCTAPAAWTRISCEG
jgi:Ca2+-binding RTX toxin-like protein